MRRDNSDRVVEVMMIGDKVASTKKGVNIKGTERRSQKTMDMQKMSSSKHTKGRNADHRRNNRGQRGRNLRRLNRRNM